MKNFALVVSVVAVAVLVAVLYLVFSGSERSSSEDNISSSPVGIEKAPETQPTSGTATLASILERGEALECSINYTDDNSGQVVEGTYFTKAGAVRGDFVVPGINGTMVSSMIVRDGFMYSWSEIEGETYGMKINLETLAEQKATNTGPDTRETVPMDSSVNYNCKAWLNLDDSIFETPTDVLFKDYIDVMNVGMEFGTVYDEEGGRSAQCMLCDRMASGEGKDQCVAAFNCF
jgi:hypothetical protein